MPGIGAIQITSPGAVARPPAISPQFSAALPTVFKPYGASEVVFLPSLKAILFCNGIDFQYHAFEENQYLTGPLAPPTAPTVVGSGTQRSIDILNAAGPVNNDTIQIGKPGAPGGGIIVFKTVLDPTDARDQVLITTLNGTTENIALLIGSGQYPAVTPTVFSGVQGNQFWSYRMSQGAPTTRWAEDNDLEVVSVAGTTVRVRVITYGTVGNSYNFLDPSVGVPITFPNNTPATPGTHSQATFPGTGTYQHAYANYRRPDSAQTAISPFKQTQNGDNSDMTVSGFAAPPARDGETDKRVFRSVVNGGAQFYKEADTTAASFTDFYNDSQLVGDNALLYDPRLFRPYTAGYPTRFSHGVLYRDSIFGCGAVVGGVYSHNNVTVTKGLRTVTFNTTNPLKADIIGRLLRIATFTTDYIIVDFVESSQVATLNTPYLDATNANALYTLKDSRDQTEIYWCTPGLYNNWPFGNSIDGVTTPHPAGVTAIAAAFDGLVAFTRTGAWRIFGAPSTGFKVVPQAEGMGCFNGRCVSRVEGVVYWLGADGIFMWSEGSVPESISAPPPTAKAKPRGIQQTIQRINLDESDGIFAVYNPSTRFIRWFVPLDGASFNNFVIVYDLQTGAFTLDTCGPATYGAALIGPGGAYVTTIGDAIGNLWQYDTGLSDGAYGFDPLHLVSTYNSLTNTITFITGGLPTDDSLAGAPILIVAALNGVVQTGYIASNTVNSVTLISPLVIAPVVTDTCILGGIELRIQSSQYDFGAPEFRKIISSVIVSFTPQTVVEAQMWVAGGGDNTVPKVSNLRSTGQADYANLSIQEGQRVMYLLRGKYRRPQFEFLALCPGFEVEILSLVINNPMQNQAAE